MKRMQAGNPISLDGGVKLIPVQQLSVQEHHTKRNGFVIYIWKEPVGIVIISPKGKHAVDINGESLPLETYFQHVSGLEDMVQSL